MQIAIVGCGYVADFYLRTLANHPELTLVGVFDRDPKTLARFAEHHGVAAFSSLKALVESPQTEIVVNLTSPRSHYEVSRAALLAGKHVYSEKPLSTDLSEAEELVALAEERGLALSSAPCNLLSESAQTMWKLLREGAIGTPRIAYAELDDGPIPLLNCRDWRSDSGSPWPYKDEFAVGCTLEHAGYYLSWLTAFFGPAKSVTSFATLVVPDKGPDVLEQGPDFSVACVTYHSGPVARITCSVFAPHDHSLRIIGDGGVLSVDECWDYGAPIYLSKRNKLGLKMEKHPRLARLTGLGPRRMPLVSKPSFAFKTKGANRMDFARGIAELADAIRAGRSSRLSARFSLHVNEIVLAIQSPQTLGSPRTIKSTFQPVLPMDWAEQPSGLPFGGLPKLARKQARPIATVDRTDIA